MSRSPHQSDPVIIRRRCRLALIWAVPVGVAHFCYWLYLLLRSTAGSTLADIATLGNLGNATLSMGIAFTATAIIVFLCTSPRLDRRDVFGAMVAALSLAALPLIIVLDQAFYMNPEDIYVDRESGIPHLGEIFILCYPWIFLISLPGLILILAALIQDRRQKEKSPLQERAEHRANPDRLKLG